MSSSITCAILAHNEEKNIGYCIDTLSWCDKILVIDNNSSDKTATIALEKQAEVIYANFKSFAKARNFIKSKIKTDWVFFIDADERVTPQLAREIIFRIEQGKYKVFSIKRQNVNYGRFFKYTGYDKDIVTRIFYKKSLKKWVGDIHESPIFEGEDFLLSTPLIHFSHRNFIQGLEKSIKWTPIEAKLFINKKIKKVGFFTILRKGIMEFLRRAIFYKGYKDKTEGLIEALVQGMNRMFVYIQIWEMQQKPSLESRYKKFEQDIVKQWKNTKYF